ncbi:MAG: class I SAM-dependent methyltransferase [Planctomycetota bacterium]
MTEPDLYEAQFVRGLFDEMAGTYGAVNLIASLGFCVVWRRQCARAIDVGPDDAVLDLMTGMGELCPSLAVRLGDGGRLLALDISPVMCARARRLTPLGEPTRYEVIEADALDCPLPDGSVDAVFSSFGLKTFDDARLAVLAKEVARVLKPGGRFAFLEISVPPWPPLRWVYMFYINRLIPLIGRLCLGNPDNYRLLGVYTEAFGDCRRVVPPFEAAGLTVELKSYFFGCATGVIGQRP